MRIISQNGTLDLPYDSTVLGMTETHLNGEIHSYIVLGYCSQLQECQEIAEYKTREKAKKAMELFMQKYIERSRYFQFPTDEEIEV